MATLSQIRTIVRQFISQTDTGNTDFTDAELNAYINMGVRYLGALVKQPRRLTEIQVQEGYSAYTLPSDAVIIRTAYFGSVSDGDAVPLEVLTEEGLKGVVPRWLSEASSDRGRPQRMILLDRTTVVVNPTPNAEESATGKKLRITYVYQPATLSGDGESPDLPIVYHDFISEYANHLCCMGKLKEAEKGIAILKIVDEKAKKFENLIVKDTEAGFGFSWGGSIDPRDDGLGWVRP